MANQNRIFYDLVHSPDDGGWYAEVFYANNSSKVIYETGILKTKSLTMMTVLNHYPTAELLKEF